MKKTVKQGHYSGQIKESVCSSCGKIKVQPENIWFDDKGFGYSTRLTRCPNCGKIIILGYIEDYGLDANSDCRYFEYK